MTFCCDFHTISLSFFNHMQQSYDFHVTSIKIRFRKIPIFGVIITSTQKTQKIVSKFSMHRNHNNSKFLFSVFLCFALRRQVLDRECAAVDILIGFENLIYLMFLNNGTFMLYKKIFTRYNIFFKVLNSHNFHK